MEFRQEKLQLSMNAMFSRVGGLCSLYLGLTCAFFIEIIEFFYLLRQQNNDNRNSGACEEVQLKQVDYEMCMEEEFRKGDGNDDCSKEMALLDSS